MSTDTKKAKEGGEQELDASVLSGLANPEADADKLRQGDSDIGPKGGKNGDEEEPEKKDEVDDNLEDGSKLGSEADAEAAPEELRQRSAPMPQGQTRGGGGGGGDALAGALAGVINGTSSVVGDGAKLAGGGLRDGTKLAGKGISAGVGALKSRMGQKSLGRVERYIEQVEASEKALSSKIKAHNEKYEPFAQHVRDLEASDAFQKKFSDDVERRQQAVARAFDDMPAYASDESARDFQESMGEITGMSENHLDTLGQATNFEKSLQNAPAETQERFKDVLERNTDVNNVLENASKTSTLDGQDDPELKERLKEATEKLQEMLRNFIAKFMPKSPGMGK